MDTIPARRGKATYLVAAFSSQSSAPIISAIQTVQQMKSASDKTDDKRMKALAAATAVSAASSGAAAAQNPTEGVTVSLTIGASKSDSQSTQTTSSAAGSSIKAGGDVIITASGDGQNSHLNVIGSDIDAGRNATVLSQALAQRLEHGQGSR